MGWKEIVFLNGGSTGREASFAVVTDEYQVFGPCIRGCTTAWTSDLCQFLRRFVRCEAVAKNNGIAATILPKATTLSKDPFGAIMDR